MPASFGYDSNKKYDAIVVLGGGLVRAQEGYASTSYDDCDLSGMLGGRMRVLAAAALLGRNASRTFVFTTGVTRRNRDEFGPDVPTEASVYAQEFSDLLAAKDRPRIVLEERSVNTGENLLQCADIIRRAGWQSVGVVTSDYHLPRVQALTNRLSWDGWLAEITHISAETVLQEEQPGVFDAMIAAAYASPAGQLRLRNEAIGLQKIVAGGYDPREQRQSSATGQIATAA